MTREACSQCSPPRLLRCEASSLRWGESMDQRLRHTMTSVPDTLQMRAGTLGTVVGAMWVIHVLDVLVPGAGSVLGHGFVPRTLTGLEAIPAAPWIHGSFQHLIANTIPFLILGGLVLLRGVLELVFVVLTCLIVARAGTWALGAGNTQHISASGIVFGLFGYLLLRPSSIAACLPPRSRSSWQPHMAQR